MGKVAVVGATGLFGQHLCRVGAELGHEIIAISRGKSAHNAQTIEALSANPRIQFHFADQTNIDAMTAVFKDNAVDVVICLVKGVAAVITAVEPVVHEAARRAGVKRFVPDEFGIDTASAPVGTGRVFDAKKQMQQLLKQHQESLPWTIVFGGGIFDYFLPNNHYSKGVRFLGDLHRPHCLAALPDIARFTFLAAFDPRTLNHCVAVRTTITTQADTKALLHKLYPGEHDLEMYDDAAVLDMLAKAKAAEAASPSAETSEAVEGYEIYKAVYVEGRLMYDRAAPHLLDAEELWPGSKVVTPEEYMRVRENVFKQ
jgi:hypothetical protein